MNLMKHWPLSTGLILCLLLGGSSLDERPVTTLSALHQNYTPFMEYASWFDGISFNPSQFHQHYKKRGFSEQDIWKMYLTLDKLGSITVTPKQAQHQQLISEALHWRQELMQQLIGVKSPAQWDQWKNEFSFTWNAKTHQMNDDEQKIFAWYVGTSPDQLEALLAGQRASYLSVVARINMATQRSDLAPTPHSIELGPSTPIQQEYGWSGVFLEAGKSKKTSATPQEAYNKLQSSVETYGLKGIRIPLGSIQDISDLDTMNNNVAAFANALSIRTKMGPQALGLNERLFWTIGASDQPLARAHIQQIDGNTYAIQSPWDSVGHEWFHALTWTMAHATTQERFPWAGLKNNTWPRNMPWTDRQAIKSFWELRYNIQYARPKKSSWGVLMEQANHRTQQFLIQKWKYDPFKTPENFQTGSETQAIQLSLRQFSSSYDAAVVATHIYWLNNPKTSHPHSTWVARRMLMDRMLNKTGWSGAGALNMKPGYFTEPEEWLAGSFQADMRVFTNVVDADTSLVSTPLPQEAQEYSRHWDHFFHQLGPWWQAHHAAPSS